MRPWALISGGTSGIGLATAKLLRDDFRLVLTYCSDHARAQQVQSDFGGDALVQRLDVSQDESVCQGLEDILGKMACAPAVLVNCAGVSKTGRFLVQSSDLSLIKQQFEVNFFGTVRMCQVIVKKMYAARQGVIVNLGSATALGGNLGVIGYAESKAAVVNFTTNLGMEVAPRGLRVHCVSPGRVDTPLIEDLVRQCTPQSLNPPLGRFIAAEEVAQVIHFLIHHGQAQNGHNLVLDGGSAWQRSQPKLP